MTYYDQTFEPYKIVNGKCVVADEAEWENLRQIDLVECLNPDGGHRWDCEGRGEDFCPDCGWPEADTVRPIVKVPTDIFEDVEGGVFDSEFRHLFDLESEAIRPRDLFTRFFQAMDSTPHVDYLIVTKHPELVREKWMCPNCKAKCSIQFSCDTCLNMSVGFGERPNVILAVPVETQSDIERLVPELLKCHDLCRELAVVCNPKEELDFDSFGPEKHSCLTGWKANAKNERGWANTPCLDRIIVECNEHPIHPDWLRSLRDQCLDASVPFNFASWGEWAPRTTHGESLTGQDQHTAFIDGMPGDKFPEDYRMVKWGRERSGRLLDGQEHNGRLA